MKTHRLLIAVTLSCCCAGSLGAEDASYDSPRPEHALLKRLAGEWRYAKSSPPSEGAEAQDLGSGRVEAEMLGEFFVVCRWSGDVYGTDLKAVQSFGYDVQQQQYAGFWIDSITSYQWRFSGVFDSEKNELVVTATGPGPNDSTATFRERYRFNSADSITVTGEMLDGEKWVPFMTTELTRDE